MRLAEIWAGASPQRGVRLFVFRQSQKVQAITPSPGESKNRLCVSEWFPVKSWFKPATRGPGSMTCTLPALCSPPAPVGDPQQASPSAYGRSCQGKQQLQLPRKSHLPAAFALWPGSPPANTPHQHSSVPVPLRQDSDAPRRAGTRALSQSRCDTTLQHTRPRLLPFTPHSVSLSGA